MNYYKDKIVWITGASSGIGSQLAIQCAAQGASVILSGRNKSSLESVRLNLLNPENHLVLPLDLEHSENFKSLAAEVIEKYGRIDILINNGGISQRAAVIDADLSIDRKIMEVNYFGNIALTKAVLPYMIDKKQGHIVVISSIAGKFGFFLRSAYSAAKHALHGFYESLMLEQESNGIKVTIACPGKINTNISVNAIGSDGNAHGIMDHNQATGMSAEKCVKILLSGVAQNKKEILIGNKEIFAVHLKRLLPKNMFWNIIKKQSPT